MKLGMRLTAGSDFIKAFGSRYPKEILSALLIDHTTCRNIVWADNEYEVLGKGYMHDDEITVDKIAGFLSGVIKPRVAKEQEHRSHRTKIHAEVFTPSWLCNRMNNDIDAIWFNKRDVFNVEGNRTWATTSKAVIFPKTKGHGWHAYIESPRLEIACGEAPFVCSRYDTVSGYLLPVKDRIGFLDRKLRIVSEKTKTRKDWVKWALAALKASYGFDYQGDNLLLARINVFETFCEHLWECWNTEPTLDEMRQVASIASWNFWQMNGFTRAAPTHRIDNVIKSAIIRQEVSPSQPIQPSLFDQFDSSSWNETTCGIETYTSERPIPQCFIYDWQKNKSPSCTTDKRRMHFMDKKFYAVIGNPPYQEESETNQRNPPIYNLFMDEAYAVSNKVELITPARFLFDAGQTPKEWNRRMLHDPHLKVMEFDQDASAIFMGVDIKGGVAITYHDTERDFGEIGTYVAYEPMRSVITKVTRKSAEFLSDIVTGAVPYKFTDKVKVDHPELVGLIGRSFDLRTNSLDKLYDKLFFKQIPNNSSRFIAIYGLFNKKRECLWINREYIDTPSNFNAYKVLIPKACGSGTYGEKLPSMEIAAKEVGHTQSFISMGNFTTEKEASCLSKYLKTKFARSLLGILKVTQDVSPRVWSLIPLQDFTSDSDVNWSQSIQEIDKDLFKKYGLDKDEIYFIESNIKEMD